jgi:uridine kinase
MRPVQTEDAVDAIRACSAPPRMRTRIVAIDGPGGSGKSSLAATLARALGASIVHTDDFASWNNPVDWWPELVERVLEPLTSGRPARFTPTSWAVPEREEVVIAPGDLVLLEGVSSSRAAFRPYLAFTIWVATPRGTRLRRGLDRDGDDALPDWERWMTEEEAYVEREQPAAHADLILPGDADLWS